MMDPDLFTSIFFVNVDTGRSVKRVVQRRQKAQGEEEERIDLSSQNLFRRNNNE